MTKLFSPSPARRSQMRPKPRSNPLSGTSFDRCVQNEGACMHVVVSRYWCMKGAVEMAWRPRCNLDQRVVRAMPCQPDLLPREAA